MKRLIGIFMLCCAFICVSCGPAFYLTNNNDELHVGYEIVYVNNLPYLYRDNVFVPYHHNTYLRHHPTHFERRPYRTHVKPTYSNPHSNRYVHKTSNRRPNNRQQNSPRKHR